jgi:hypothetical protein
MPTKKKEESGPPRFFDPLLFERAKDTMNKPTACKWKAS